MAPKINLPEGWPRLTKMPRKTPKINLPWGGPGSQDVIKSDHPELPGGFSGRIFFKSDGFSSDADI